MTMKRGFFATESLSRTGVQYHRRGEEAQADLVKALELTTDSRARLDIWLVLGENCKTR